jgi:hypothetical protein
LPLTAVLVDIISDVVGHPSISRFAVATLRVLSADFEQPHIAIFGVAKVVVTGVAHFGRSKTTPPH